MDVLVTGGTGFIGPHLCRTLHDRGHAVTAMARTPDEADLPAGVDTVSGDVTEPSTLDVVPDYDVVINLVSLSPLYKVRGEQTHDRVHRQGTQNLLDAADGELDRFVQMSALDADPDGPTGYIRAKGRAEEVVKDADVEYTIIRPSVVFGEGSEFIEFPKETKRLFAPGLPIAPLPGGGRTRFQPIYVGDLVSMIADSIEDDRHANQTYEFGGPTVLTLAEVTRLVFETAGNPVRVVPIPMPLARIGMTVMELLPFLPFGRDQYRSLSFDNTVQHNDCEKFGYSSEELVEFSAFLDDEMSPESA